jgi:hypothetical protein
MITRAFSYSQRSIRNSKKIFFDFPRYFHHSKFLLRFHRSNRAARREIRRAHIPRSLNPTAPSRRFAHDRACLFASSRAHFPNTKRTHHSPLFPMVPHFLRAFPAVQLPIPQNAPRCSTFSARSTQNQPTMRTNATERDILTNHSPPLPRRSNINLCETNPPRLRPRYPCTQVRSPLRDHKTELRQTNPPRSRQKSP